MKLTDESIITFGIHKGKALEDVPASYLLFLYDNNRCGKDLREYIEENIDVLKHEIKTGKK